MQNIFYCAVVDDEPLARRLICEYISKTPGLELAGSCSGPLEAVALLGQGGVDILFADIEMPGLSGLDMIKALKTPPAVILITAYQNYAIDAFELGAVDYMLKPVVYERFLKAVDKARASVPQTRATSPEQGKTPSMPANGQEDFFFVKADHKLYKIRFDEILYIEGMKEYVRIHTADKKIMPLMSLSKLEAMLPAHAFARTHKSFIVGLKKIGSIDGNSVTIGKESIPIGKSYKESFMLNIGKMIL